MGDFRVPRQMARYILESRGTPHKVHIRLLFDIMGVELALVVSLEDLSCHITT